MVFGHDGYDDGRDLGSGYIGRVRTPREKRGRNLDDYERSGMIGAAAPLVWTGYGKGGIGEAA